MLIAKGKAACSGNERIYVTGFKNFENSLSAPKSESLFVRIKNGNSTGKTELYHNVTVSFTQEIEISGKIKHIINIKIKGIKFITSKIYEKGGEFMKKVGLALGGGAAHGVAHLGVLQVFLEQGIPIDYVSGCSAGAIAGALFCTGSDMYLAGKLCSTIDMSSFIDVIIPRIGFIKGEKAENLVNMLVKGKNLEECSPPFSAIACDVLSGKCVMLDKGNLAKACHASFAIPGVFEPVDFLDMQLIDGGAMTRVPVDEVKKMGAEYVIAVDVGYQGWGHEKAKNLIDIIMYAFEMCDWQMVEQMYKKSDCVINPDLRQIPLQSLEKSEECIALGREAALKVVDKIKADLGIR